MTHGQFLPVGANAALAVIHFAVYVRGWTLLPLAFMQSFVFHSHEPGFEFFNKLFAIRA